MGGNSKGGGSQPKPPDPRETAAAEAQYNRLDTYSPSGAGVRHGYSVPAGSGVPQIEVIAGTPNRGYRVGGGEGAAADWSSTPWSTQTADTYRVGDRTFTDRGEAEAYRGTLGSGENQFVQGVAPEGYQSAVTYIESPYEKQIREALEPASVALTDRVIDDNIYNMPDAPRAKDRSDVAQDLFDRTFSLMAPGIDRSNDRLLTNLQSRGIPIGSEAFNETYGDQQRQTQDTISRLAMDANLNAGAEQNREFALDQASRSGAIAELVAAMGGGYNPPNSVPSGNAPPINYSGMVSQQYQGQLANYQQQQQQGMATAGALGSIGSALIKSTREAKDIMGPVDRALASEAIMKMPVLAWTYKAGHAPPHDNGKLHVGPVAEDFQKITGLGASDRIDPVDYFGLLTAALQGAIEWIALLEARMQALERDGEDEDEVDGRRLN